MPPPSTENDLKRRARRRLIGAVALTLLAVIVLPLLLEDEPPPASQLAVKMAVAPEPEVAEPAAPAVVPAPVPAHPLPAQGEHAAVAEPVPEPIEAAPDKPEPLAQAARPPARPAVSQAAAAGSVFVVQLAALSDAAKANDLKARAAQTGFPSYTDTAGNLTRVRVGPFPSRAAAVAAALKRAERGMAGQVVAQ